MTTCPNCGYEFDLNEEISKEVNQKNNENKLLREQLEEVIENSEKTKNELREELEEKIKNEMEDKINKIKEQKDEENKVLQKSLEEIRDTSEKTKNVLRKELEEQIKSEMEDKINKIKEQKDEENKLLQKSLEEIRDTSEKTKNVLRKELEEEIKNDLENRLKDNIKEKEQQQVDKIKALEMQIEKMKVATRKASDVADNTSNDIKGKLGEFNLEMLIRGQFPNDRILKLGTRGGGDFAQTVIEGNHKCGKILYECKYAERFNKSEWLPKIKEDSLLELSDRNVIVTKVMPVGNDDKGNDIRIDKIDPCRIDGVWICTYNSVAGVISLLRDSVVHQDIANVSQFDRSNKKEDLYEYIVSNEFMNDGNNFRETLVKRRNYLEDYLKRTVRSIKVQIDETSGLITKFDNMVSRITDITGKCADTEIVDKDDNEEFLKSIIDSSKGIKKKKSLDQKQYTMDDAWN